MCVCVCVCVCVRTLSVYAAAVDRVVILLCGHDLFVSVVLIDVGV